MAPTSRTVREVRYGNTAAHDRRAMATVDAIANDLTRTASVELRLSSTFSPAVRFTCRTEDLPLLADAFAAAVKRLK